MKSQGIYVNGVSEELYREIKAQSARLGKTLGAENVIGKW